MGPAFERFQDAQETQIERHVHRRAPQVEEETIRNLEGRKARIEYHEEQRDGFTNVYLDKVEELPEKHADADRDVEEVAWKTAIDAAPWLVGPEQESRIPPEELFETLQPFKDLVAEDIREDG